MSSFCYFIHFINQLSSMISSPIHSSVTLTSCLLFLCLYICCVMLYSVILPSIKILLESKRQVLLYLLHLLTQAIFVDKQFAFSFYIILLHFLLQYPSRWSSLSTLYFCHIVFVCFLYMPFLFICLYIIHVKLCLTHSLYFRISGNWNRNPCVTLSIETTTDFTLMPALYPQVFNSIAHQPLVLYRHSYRESGTEFYTVHPFASLIFSLNIVNLP